MPADSIYQDGSSRQPRPNVNIPPGYMPNMYPAQSFQQQAPYLPSTSTLPEYTYYPSSGRPLVNLPFAGHTNDLSAAQLNHASYEQQPAHPLGPPDFEAHFRNMIIHNSSPLEVSETSLRKVALDQSKSTIDDGTRTRRRPNQAQRRQQAQEFQQRSTHNFMAQPATTPPNEEFSRGQVQRPQPNRHAQIASSPSYQRPLLDRTPMLYDPKAATSRGSSPRFHGPTKPVPWISPQDQVNWMDRLAFETVPKVEISAEEYAEKQQLRLRLQDICRDAVTRYETDTDPSFDSRTVELKSFGSLGIGFATRDSDMDLVLVSPQSRPELASPESKIPRLVEKALMDVGYGVRLLTQTRVPIIKFCEKPGPQLAGCLRFTRLQWQDECNGLMKQSSKTTSRESPASMRGKDMALQNNPEQAQEAVSSAKESGTYPSKFADNGDARLDTSIESGALCNPSESAHCTSGQENQHNEDHKSEVSKIENQGSSADNEGEALPTSKECEHLQISNYSDDELAGMLSRSEITQAQHAQAGDLIDHFVNTLEAKKYPHQAGSVAEARAALNGIPDILQFSPSPTRADLEYPKDGVGTQCDINFSNELALHNSSLLKCYSTCDPRVRIMVLFVKAWTKARKINSPYHGSMNSYGYVLMVLHYLVNIVRPPVLPNLQLMHNEIHNDPLSASQQTFNNYNIQFYRNEDRLGEKARRGQITSNQDSVGTLLCGFFQYYAQPPSNGFRWKDDVLSLRTPGGLLTKRSKGWIGARSEMVKVGGNEKSEKKVNHHYVVAIEDPFEINHNVARTVFFHGIVAIRDEFRRAVSLIASAGVDAQKGPQDFFAEGNKNENLQSRGPRSDNTNGGRQKKPSQDATKSTSQMVQQHLPDGQGLSNQKIARGSV